MFPKRVIVTIILFFTMSYLYGQGQPYNYNLLDTLAQISNSNTISKYFAKLYYGAIEMTNQYANNTDEVAKKVVFSFEKYFEPPFINAHKNFLQKNNIAFEWQRYYVDTTLNKLQYYFMGMNAHINGDMWFALKQSQPYDTLIKYRKTILKYQVVLNNYFDSVYQIAMQYKTPKLLNTLSLGLGKFFGKQILLHWRRRQIRLAILAYTNPQKCKRKLLRVHKQMIQFDRLAVKWLK